MAMESNPLIPMTPIRGGVHFNEKTGQYTRFFHTGVHRTVVPDHISDFMMRGDLVRGWDTEILKTMDKVMRQRFQDTMSRSAYELIMDESALNALATEHKLVPICISLHGQWNEMMQSFEKLDMFFNAVPEYLSRQGFIAVFLEVQDVRPGTRMQKALPCIRFDVQLLACFVVTDEAHAHFAQHNASEVYQY